jgi:(p)ppGpp synthase/HD superfamily hydrolase
LDFKLIDKAIYWAKKYHDGQFRKSGEPYYTHPLEVAYLVSEYNLTTNVIVTAILHDVVEDSDATVGMIVDAFSWRIAEMVDRLTRDRPDGSKLSVETILNNAYEKNDKEVLLIKVVDRLHNVQTIRAKTSDKQKKTTTETLEFFMVVIIYAEYKNIEDIIYQICCKNLSIKIPLNENTSYLDYLDDTDNHQLVSQVFQNVTTQTKNTG